MSSCASSALSAVPDQGLFFRTSPSDSLQAQAIADVIMRGGAQKVFLVARDDTYGQEKDQFGAEWYAVTASGDQAGNSSDMSGSGGGSGGGGSYGGGNGS